jgi:hypothetical protein
MKPPRVKFHWLFLTIMILPILAILAGCTGNKNSITLAPMANMPGDIQNAASSVSEAYRFAVANPEALKNVPCYCGCGSMGHTSNYSCYVTEVKAGGQVEFDQHALGCSICVDITQDVIRLTKEGKSAQEIRAAIDQTYSQYGPSNMPSGN